MNKNDYILPVSATFRDIQYPEPIVKSNKHLEELLKEQSYSVSIGNSLGGHTTNTVFEGTMDKKAVIVKHTEHSIPQTPIEYMIMSDAHDTEVKILKKLQNSETARAPKLLANAQKIKTLVIEDLRASGFQDISKLILKKKFPVDSAEQFGTALAQFAVETRTWEEFKTNESAVLAFYEHSLEMLIAYPNEIERYKRLEAAFSLKDEELAEDEAPKRLFVWAESSPENVLITKDGKLAFIDFGRSYWGDQQFMLASFIAHLLVNTLVGFISVKDVSTYIPTCLKAYVGISPLDDESVVVEYIAMEMLHRAHGKGFQGIKNTAQSLEIEAFARSILDSKVKTIKKLLTSLGEN